VVDRSPGARADGDVTGGDRVTAGSNSGASRTPGGSRPSVDEPATLGDLEAGRAEQRPRGRPGPAAKKTQSPGGADVGGQTGPLGVGEVLGHGPPSSPSSWTRT
jgi:hypothetical protein